MTLAVTYKLPRFTPAGTPRVLHVRTVKGNGGGPEKTLLRGAVHLRRLGVHAEALYLLDAHTPSDALIERASRSELTVHVVRERSALDPAGPGALARLIRTGRFDIIHTHDYKANALARMLMAAGRYRIVATAHGYNQTTRREGAYYALERMILRRADAVICPSRRLADLLADSGVSPERLHVIHNGIELDQWPFRPRGVRKDPPVVLYVGRLSREKNVQALLQAAAMLRRRGAALRLRIAGQGPAEEELAELAGQLGLDGQIEWLGWRADVSDLLAGADLFVNPSTTEAMPNSVLEALATGTPVVATDAGATDELVLHERTGLLIPPGDVGALAEALGRLLADADLGRALAWQGRSHVEEHFDFARRMAHVVALYRGVLAAAGWPR
ncbi:MAG: glycosyltransferase family 4 protein [Planctomycetes bacterium]|nr:glycosyltransferase family 4 protein [Planctomycetota bacterium]